MQRNEEGFLYPILDKDKCIICDLCNIVCPALELCFKPTTHKEPKCYAAWAHDDIRLKSSSGGLFSVLAEKVLDKSGLVCGVAFDKDWYAEHIIISDKEDLSKIRTSKYLQSDTKVVFKEIKKLLRDKTKTVLFSGTPCEVAGLYGFLRKDYDNLLTVDVLCHGTPSPAVWNRYLGEICKNEKIESINFRNKIIESPSKSTSYKWKDYNFTIDTIGQKEGNKTQQWSHKKDVFMQGFLKNLYLRKSCATCHFTNVTRVSDITLGDFWGIDKFDENLSKNGKGISLALINTDKGEAFFDAIKDKLGFIQEVPMQIAVGGNKVLKEPATFHNNRSKFFQDFAKLEQNESIIDLIGNHLGKKDVGIMNFSFPQYNYGALLVAFAMEKAVKKLGYNPYHINFMPDKAFKTPSPFWDFRNNFLHLTDICSNGQQLRDKVNNRFDKFIIGSDQVWRWHKNFVYYCNWVKGNKTIISYAASFGKEKTDTKDANRITEYLKRFDAISVREKSGVDICKNEFKVQASHVIDPTMLLSQEDYQEVIDKENSDISGMGEYVAYYVLDKVDYAELNRPEVLSDIKKRYILVDIMKDENNNHRTFGQWLNLIKNAKYVITSSFHGTVFSIIFKKEFITITTANRGNERIKSLFASLGGGSVGLSKDRFCDNFSQINQNSFKSKINYAKLQDNLERERKVGMDYLSNALKIQLNKKNDILIDVKK
jgi:coenzyme F420-reducing hydrogenase beta subunit